MAAVLHVEGLPDAPLDAAAAFHGEWLAAARTELGKTDGLVLLLAPADHTHGAWRLAAVQELAREAAPKRVNAVVGRDEHAIAETLAFLDAAPGITGQVFAVDGKTRETA